MTGCKVLYYTIFFAKNSINFIIFCCAKLLNAILTDMREAIELAAGNVPWLVHHESPGIFR